MDEKLYYSNGPSEWQYKQLGDVVTFQGGSQPPKKYFSNEELEGMIRLIQIRDYKSDSFKTYVPKELCRRFCNSDDIMIGRYGPPIFQILRGIEGAYNVALIKVIPNEELVNKEYLYYFIKNEHLFKLIDGLSQRTSGQTGIDMEVLKKYIIPIPNKDEQEKIASIFSTVDEQIDNVDGLIEKNKKLKKGLMQTLLTKGIGHTKFKKTEIGEIPEEWEITSFKEVSKVSQGLQIAIEERYKEHKEGRLPYITIQYINDKTNSDNEYFIENYNDSVVCNKDEILMTRTGNTGIVVTNEIGVFHNNFFKVDFRRDLLNKDFLVYFLKTTFMQSLIIRYAGTTTIPDLKHGDFYKLPVVIPSLEEQKKIASILSELDEKIEGYENKKQKLEELKRGLMQQLLTGKIRTI